MMGEMYHNRFKRPQSTPITRRCKGLRVQGLVHGDLPQRSFFIVNINKTLSTTVDKIKNHFAMDEGN